jgi:hypothetical protein
MRRVAVFGNAGGGKSTLARRLAAATRLPLHVIDEMQFRAGGVEVPQAEYLRNHAELLSRAEWIIDGRGCPRRIGAVRCRRYPGPCRSPADYPLLVGHETADARALRDSQRLAGGQPGLEQLHEQLPRHLELPHAAHSQISRADRGKRFVEARSPLALSRRDRSVHRSCRARVLPRHGSRVTPTSRWSPYFGPPMKA